MLREIASGLDLGMAAYDGRLSILWANAVMRGRLSELTELGGDDAVASLFGGSGVLPRWKRLDVPSPVGDLPCLGVDLERGRSALRSVVVPCVEAETELDALLLIVPSEGPGPIGSLPVEPTIWRAALDRCRVAVAATPSGGELRVLGGADAVVLAGLRGRISERVRSPSRDAIAEGDRGFREGSAVGGDEAVSLATPEGGLARGRLLWATVVHGLAPRVKLEVFCPADDEAGAHRASSSDHAQRLVTASPDALLLVDGRRVIAANPAVSELFGHSPERLIGEDLTVLAPPGDSRLDAFAARLSVGLEVPLRAVVGVSDPSNRRIEVELHAAETCDGGETEFLTRWVCNGSMGEQFHWEAETELIDPQPGGGLPPARAQRTAV